MQRHKSIKVIFDTNIWISFLIGKRLRSISKYIADAKIIIITSDELLNELEEAALRPRLRKYFPSESVHELLVFLKSVGLNVSIRRDNDFLPDLKDSFLLDIIEKSKANYLVTVDRALQ